MNVAFTFFFFSALDAAASNSEVFLKPLLYLFTQILFEQKQMWVYRAIHHHNYPIYNNSFFKLYFDVRFFNQCMFWYPVAGTL